MTQNTAYRVAQRWGTPRLCRSSGHCWRAGSPLQTRRGTASLHGAQVRKNTLYRRTRAPHHPKRNLLIPTSPQKRPTKPRGIQGCWIPSLLAPASATCASARAPTTATAHEPTTSAPATRASVQNGCGTSRRRRIWRGDGTRAPTHSCASGAGEMRYIRYRRYSGASGAATARERQHLPALQEPARAPLPYLTSPHRYLNLLLPCLTLPRRARAAGAGG